ncbi:MAG: protein kinase domain-containing protein, partial [Phycisphaerales bacterium]
VTEHDNQPRPKIIDFGISKALGRPLTDKIIFTHDGRMMGVPEYISPEQAQGLDVDTRADVYSLGVLLYELLTGAPPFDRSQLLSRGWEAMLRFIREAERPHPSTRLSNLGDSAGEIARRRQARPATLSGELSRGLGWIPLRALEPERAHRYQTPAELAADIRRYLNDDYDPPFGGRTLDRLRRFTRRNRRVLAAAAVVFLALSAWLVGALYQLRQTRIAEANAVSEARAARLAEDAAAREAYEANIAAAGSFISVGDSQAARLRLGRCDPARRRWEWYALNRRAGGHSAVTDFNMPLARAVFDRRDGSILAVTLDSRYRLDNPSLKQRPGATGRLRFLDRDKPSPDRSSEIPLGTLDHGDRILLRKFIDGRPLSLRILDLRDNADQPIALPAGSRLNPDVPPASGHESPVAVVPVIDATGSHALLVVHRDTTHAIPLPAPPGAVTVSPDGLRIAAAFAADPETASVLLWDLDNPDPIRRFAPLPIGRPADLALTPTALAIAGTRAAAAFALDAAPHTEPLLLPGRADRAAIDPTGQWLALALGRDLRLHNLRTGDRSLLLGHRQSISSLAFAPDGSAILAGSGESAFLRLWSIEADVLESGLASTTAAWSDASGGKIILRGEGSSPTLRLFDTRNRTFSDLPVGDASAARGCALSADGSHFALLRSAGVELWTVSPPALVHAWPADESGIDDGPGTTAHFRRLAFAPGMNTRLFIAARPRRTPAAFDSIIYALDTSAEAATVIHTIHDDDLPVPSILSAPSPHVLLAANLHRVFAWSPSAGDTPVSLKGNTSPSAIAPSPDGRRAAFVGLPGNVFLVPTSAEAPPERQTGHQPFGRDVVWLGDNQRLASGASDGTIIIWATDPLRTLTVLSVDAGVVAMSYQSATKTLWVADQRGRLHRFSGEPWNPEP